MPYVSSIVNFTRKRRIFCNARFFLQKYTTVQDIPEGNKQFDRKSRYRHSPRAAPFVQKMFCYYLAKEQLNYIKINTSFRHMYINFFMFYYIFITQSIILCFIHDWFKVNDLSKTNLSVKYLLVRCCKKKDVQHEEYITQISTGMSACRCTF